MLKVLVAMVTELCTHSISAMVCMAMPTMLLRFASCMPVLILKMHTFCSLLRKFVLEAIQTRIVSNFGAFYYMFIVNVGLYKEPEFARTKIHQKLKQKHAFYFENTKSVQSVCTEVLFVLDSKKTQVENVVPIEISVFSAAAVIGYRSETNCWL